MIDANEIRVANFLQSKGYEVSYVRGERNIRDDIDLLVDGVPTSVKTQDECLRSGNICYELFVTFANGAIKPSWAFTSKAHNMLVLVGNSLYLSLGKPFYPPIQCLCIVKLKKRTQTLQRDIGHPHVDAILGLYPLEKLIEEGYLHKIGELDGE
jgi:hypothetical protein